MHFEFVDVTLTCIGEVATVLCVALPACREQQWKSPFDEDGDAGDDGGGSDGGDDAGDGDDDYGDGDAGTCDGDDGDDDNDDNQLQ